MSRWQTLGAVVDSAALPPALVRALRDFWEDAPGRLAPDGRQFTFVVGELPPVSAQAQPETLKLIEQTLMVWRCGNELWLPGLHLHVSAQGAAFTVAAQAQEPSAEHLEGWSLALTEAHRAGSWLPLHAALIARSGRAVALSGVSGAGKSTATLRLSGSYSVLAEDRSFWHAASGQVAGLDRCLRVFPDSVERFAPQLLPAALARPRDTKGKLLLPLPAAEGRATLSSVLLFSAAEHLSAAQRVRDIWEMTGVPLTLAAREQVQAGVTRLLPLVEARPVQRGDVLERVRAILDS